MQRYSISSPALRERLGIRYIGGVGEFDVFWIGDSRRLVVKWMEEWGRTCPVSKDGSKRICGLRTINKRLSARHGPKMTKEEHEVLSAMRKLFVVE